MDFEKHLTDKINKVKNVKENTLKTYISNLKKLLSKLNLEPTVDNLNNVLKNPNNVLKLLEDKKTPTKRNYLASIVVYLSTDEKFQDLKEKYGVLMKKFQEDNNSELAHNKKSERQLANWTSLKELRNILKSYKKQLDSTNALKKEELTKKEFDLLQKYVVGSLYIGDDANPPLRNDYLMDVISFKDYERLSKEEKHNNNYLVSVNKSNRFFSIGEYKTSNKYGLKEIKVGTTLNKILTTWLKFNKSKHLLVTATGGQLTPNNLTKLLIKTFEPTGKNISSSLLRSIYISEKFEPRTQERLNVADKMLHSVGMQSSVYAKE